jgi:hypothetical protein
MRSASAIGISVREPWSVANSRGRPRRLRTRGLIGWATIFAISRVGVVTDGRNSSSGELAELVEVYARPEPERVGHGLWRFAAARLCRFTQSGADCPIHRFLERNSKLARAASRAPQGRHRWSE